MCVWLRLHGLPGVCDHWGFYWRWQLGLVSGGGLVGCRTLAFVDLWVGKDFFAVWVSGFSDFFCGDC